jgi:inhibitor of cysteine peptidase
MDEVSVSEAQSGGVIAVRTGDVIVVTLHENPTTGYRWHVDPLAGIALKNDAYTASSKALGSAGERVLRFAAQTAGTFHLRAALRRSWESGVAPQSNFEITIKVT